MDARPCRLDRPFSDAWVTTARAGRIARWAWGITQLIITPEDVTIAAPQPDDAPWAGLLGGYVSWAAYDNDGSRRCKRISAASARAPKPKTRRSSCTTT